MASYTKSTSIDMSNGDGGKHAYETMADVACDSDNDDDDKVLINRQAPPHPVAQLGTRKHNGYLGLICNALMLALFVIVLVLAFFMFSLNRDLEDLRRTAAIQSSHATLMDKKLNDVDVKYGTVSKEMQKIHNASEGITKTAKTVLDLAKGFKGMNSSVKRVLARAAIYYPEYNAKFMGFGYPTNRSHWQEYHQYTLSRCLQNLHEKHATDPAWNGLAFGHSQKDGWCICYKNSGIVAVRSNHYLYYILND